MTSKELIEANNKKIRAIVLTDEEKEEAYFERQKKKYFKEKHKNDWPEEKLTITK